MMPNLKQRLAAGAWPDAVVCCVTLPHLPLRIEVLRHPELDGCPLVLGAAPGERKVVQQCSNEALAAGITPGLPLREVLALCKDAVIVEPNPVHVAQVVDGIMQRLQQVSPQVEYQPQQFFLDLVGLRELYRSDLQRLERAIRGAFPALLFPRIGVAPGKFGAALAAETAAALGIQVVTADALPAFLAPFPVRLLPFSVEQQRRLELMGLRTVGDMARLPLTAVQAQFGRQGALAWRLAQGHDDAPLVAYQPRPMVTASVQLDDPLSSVEGFYAALRVVVARAFGDDRVRTRAVRKVHLSARLSGDASWDQTLVFKGALLGRDAVLRAVKDKLLMANALPRAPLEALTLELSDLGDETGKQPSMFAKNVQQEHQIAEMARQLHARYQSVPLCHVVEVEPWSRIPERRWALTPCEL